MMRSIKSRDAYSLTLLLLLYLGLMWIPTWFAGSLSFLLAGLVYILSIVAITFLCKGSEQITFFKIVTLFLFIYSMYAMLSHFIFVDNPFEDYFARRDSTTYIKRVINLGKLDLSEIWRVSFTEFRYSDSPLFYAWSATLQRISGLKPFYGLLFQKLNVVFLGSYIPGIVYLLCKRITWQEYAFRAAIGYGFLSFVLFYSVAFLRDMHITLIYAIGLYLITGDKYNLKNYLILVLLGLCAYFIRLENGLFFLAFIGIWMYRSSAEKKWLISFVTAIGIIGVLILIGGIEGIANMAFNTIQAYSERAAEKSDAGSLTMVLRKLPIPINSFAMATFSQIRPFPFWVPFREYVSIYSNMLYIPYIIAPLFWVLVWTRILLNFKRAVRFYKKYKLVVLSVLVYLLVVSIAQPLERRLMAVYPIIYMGYIYIYPKVFIGKEILFSSLIYIGLVACYILLKI